MTPFLEQVAGLAPTIKQQLANCPQVMPNRDQLIALKPKIESAKAWISSRGQDGDLSLIQECTIFGLLDKENLPTNIGGWSSWVLNLDAQVNSAIASQNVEGANVVDRNNVNENFLNSNNYVNMAMNTANSVVSWWQTPLFSVGTYGVTPTNIAIAYGIYALTRRYRR